MLTLRPAGAHEGGPLPAPLARRLAEVNTILAAHAGGVELTALDDGVARLRFTGMCTGCPLRPVTTASTLRPALLELDGVDEVQVEGSRVSPAAERRLAAAFPPHHRWRSP